MKHKAQESLEELKIKTAKEMFEELGYSYEYEYDDLIECKKYFTKTKVTMVIQFDIEYKEYIIKLKNAPMTISASIDLEEHKAIQQQMKELGWIEE